MAPLLLAGCGTLPQPFLGRPGREGARLAVPPPPILIVPDPANAMLGDHASRLYAEDLAQALVVRNVPSLARSAVKGEWQLAATAELTGNQVEPRFSIIGPDGKTYGKSEGAPVAAGDWEAAAPATLRASATEAAPALARELGSVNAAVQQSNPNSLENRPPRLMLQAVTGAPGDGDHSLALNMRRDLPPLGIVLVDHKQDADFVLNGIVKVTPEPHGLDLVELDWMIRTNTGGFIGKVSQLHDLKPADMTPYWGDVAGAAAGQAATGIKQVITNATLKKRPKNSAPPPGPLAEAPATPSAGPSP